MRTLLEKRSSIDQLDLAGPVARARREQEWTAEEAAQAEAEYRDFLQKVADAPGDQFIHPTLIADKVWHAHIMYLENYLNDCMAIFGTVLIHQPCENIPGVECGGSGDHCEGCGCGPVAYIVTKRSPGEHV